MNTDPPRPPAPGAPGGGKPEAASPFKSSGGFSRIGQAAKYSLQGLADAFRREASFRQELILVAILVPVAAVFPFSSVERVLLIGSLLMVLIVELLNSALEATVDRISTEKHLLAGQAKDLGSAAVMLTLLLAAVTWLAIAGPIVAGLFLAPG